MLLAQHYLHLVGVVIKPYSFWQILQPLSVSSDRHGVQEIFRTFKNRHDHLCSSQVHIHLVHCQLCNMLKLARLDQLFQPPVWRASGSDGVDYEGHMGRQMCKLGQDGYHSVRSLL